MSIEKTEKLYKATRDGCDESFRIRIHRAISWVKKARALPEEDIDLKFISLWIAFNCAYGKEISTDGYFGVLTTWLNENMSHFGFFRPYAFNKGGVAHEPWHLSYYPEATQFQKLLTAEILNEVLTTHPLEGQTEILQVLPEIMEQFIMNICEGNDS